MTHEPLQILPATEWAWDGCKEDYNARANVWRECTEEFAVHVLCEMPPMDRRSDPYRFLCMGTYSHADDLEWYLAIVRIDDRCFCRILPRCRFDEMAKELVGFLKGVAIAEKIAMSRKKDFESALERAGQLENTNDAQSAVVAALETYHLGMIVSDADVIAYQKQEEATA